LIASTRLRSKIQKLQNLSEELQHCVSEYLKEIDPDNTYTLLYLFEEVTRNISHELISPEWANRFITLAINRPFIQVLSKYYLGSSPLIEVSTIGQKSLKSFCQSYQKKFFCQSSN
jgi:hypothetical protein